jgi:hypothetical protein
MDHWEAGSLVEELPLSASWRGQLLDAVILAGAWVAGGRGQVHPAARMCLLREIRLCGLSEPAEVGALRDGPPVDIMAEFDTYLRKLADPWRARRLIARQMDSFVGTPWAMIVLRIAEAVARESTRRSVPEQGEGPLRALRLSLGLCSPNDCGS